MMQTKERDERTNKRRNRGATSSPEPVHAVSENQKRRRKSKTIEVDPINRVLKVINVLRENKPTTPYAKRES